MAETRAARSRSPAATSEGPQVKDWVMTRVGGRSRKGVAPKWCDAVPALVTRVIEGAKRGEKATLELVVPNHLALRFGFGKQKPFLELTVGVKEVRPYAGSDHAGLASKLLQAIRQTKQKIVVPGLVPKRAGEPSVKSEALVPGTADAATQQAPVPTTVTEQAPVPTATEQTPVPTATEQAPMPTTTEPEPLAAPQTPVAAEAPQGETPQTPLQQSRCLVRKESEEKGAEVAVDLAAPTVIKEAEPVIQPCKVQLNLAQQHRQFTAAVARAFRAAGGDEAQLTRRELVQAVGPDFGEQEISSGLQRLDGENKIFMSGDLIFMI